MHNKLPDIHYQKIAHDVKSLFVQYIVDKEQPHHNEEFLQFTAHTALLKVAIGASFTETVTNFHQTGTVETLVPQTGWDFFKSLLPRTLQFGWFVPQYRKIVTANYYRVETKITLPNTPLPYDHKHTYYTTDYTHQV